VLSKKFILGKMFQKYFGGIKKSVIRKLGYIDDTILRIDESYLMKQHEEF
jgi:hypothetical protein